MCGHIFICYASRELVVIVNKCPIPQDVYEIKLLQRGSNTPIIGNYSIYGLLQLQDTHIHVHVHGILTSNITCAECIPSGSSKSGGAGESCPEGINCSSYPHKTL